MASIRRAVAALVLVAFSIPAANRGDEEDPSEARRYFELQRAVVAKNEAGKYRQALKHVVEMKRIAPGSAGPFLLEAQTLAGSGETDEAFAALERAIDTDVIFADLLRVDEGFAVLRSDPRFEALLVRSEGLMEEFKASLDTLHRREDPSGAPSFQSVAELRERFAAERAEHEARMAIVSFRGYSREGSAILDRKIAALRRYVAEHPEADDLESAFVELIRSAAEYKEDWPFLGGDAALIVEEAERFLERYPESGHANEVKLQRAIATWLAHGPDDRETTRKVRAQRAGPWFDELRSEAPDTREGDRALVWSLAVAAATASDATSAGVWKLYDELEPRLAQEESLGDYAWRHAPRPMFQVGIREAFDGKDLEGKRWNAAAMRGKIVLIDFWSTWCSPCLADVPYLREAYAQFHERGFEIVGVNLDLSGRKKLVKTCQEKGIVWPQIHDGKGLGGELARRFRIAALPTLVLLERQGSVVAVNDGLRGPRLVRTIGSLFDD